MTQPVLHQFLVGASPGDAITNHARLLQRWLRDLGIESHLYAGHVNPAVKDAAFDISAYRPTRKDEMVILHHSIGSDVVDYVRDLRVPVILIYHNITPSSFFEKIDPRVTQELDRGRAQLKELAPQVRLGLGDSRYNTLELEPLGIPIDVLPIPLESEKYQEENDPGLVARYQDGAPNLLFVGRLVPNKRQEDLIKLLWFYRRIDPRARLFMVGAPWYWTYEEWLHKLIDDLDLKGAAIITNHISQREMLTFYRISDCFVSMSEHEGQGIPLLESMYLGLPIMAYAAAAVPETLGNAGVLFHRKDYEALAEFLWTLSQDTALRERIIARQRERVQDFLEPAIRARWEQIVKTVL